MKILEAYSPADVRACGRMIRAIIASGGTAEDMLNYAAYAERYGANPIVARSKFSFKPFSTKDLAKEEVFRGIGYLVLRQWIKLSEMILSLGTDLKEVRSFISSERKKALATSDFGYLKP